MWSCFISWFYIKPQPCYGFNFRDDGCFISWFYIKPQQVQGNERYGRGCFISWFYIKPQLCVEPYDSFKVASYLDSTSNHNGRLEYLHYVGVASYLDSTSNHNLFSSPAVDEKLLHILILHQTTTDRCNILCIYLLLHILILHQTTTGWRVLEWVARLLHILILHQTTTGNGVSLSKEGCFISWFYIKPQPSLINLGTILRCFIAWFYIKPQRAAERLSREVRCFISWFYIKPQLQLHATEPILVASYLDSTSNHNLTCRQFMKTNVASYLDSTSNHNLFTSYINHVFCCFISWFYIKPQLHTINCSSELCCFISWFYIKPQLWHTSIHILESCFISWFYIKPQLNSVDWKRRTSCFISWFYIKPQHGTFVTSSWSGCFISWFYIKPQQACRVRQLHQVASYLDSTSNHNCSRSTIKHEGLLHILILHQTTTPFKGKRLLYGCFISWFYIKPQHLYHSVAKHCVASYLDSTSNHNKLQLYSFYGKVASYLDSTSNHNNWTHNLHMARVASYLDSTSNHNHWLKIFVRIEVASYLDSTSNHNKNSSSSLSKSLLHILILHQTTTCTI